MMSYVSYLSDLLQTRYWCSCYGKANPRQLRSFRERCSDSRNSLFLRTRAALPTFHPSGQTADLLQVDFLMPHFPTYSHRPPCIVRRKHAQQRNLNRPEEGVYVVTHRLRKFLVVTKSSLLLAVTVQNTFIVSPKLRKRMGNKTIYSSRN